MTQDNQKQQGQIEMFGGGPAERGRAPRYPGWERLSPPGKKLDARWRHSSGWEIRHCGHPTANWPYYLVDPAHPGASTMTHNGMGFATLAVAMQAVGELVAGTLRATDDNCVAGVRRVVPREDGQ